MIGDSAIDKILSVPCPTVYNTNARSTPCAVQVYEDVTDLYKKSEDKERRERCPSLLELFRYPEHAFEFARVEVTIIRAHLLTWSYAQPGSVDITEANNEKIESEHESEGSIWAARNLFFSATSGRGGHACLHSGVARPQL